MTFEDQVLHLLGDLKTEVGELRTDMSQVKTEAVELRQEVDHVKTEVVELRQEVNQMQKSVEELKLEVDEVKNDVKELKEENQLIKRAIIDPNRTVASVKMEQNTIYGILGEHEVSIRMLKEKIG